MNKQAKQSEAQLAQGCCMNRDKVIELARKAGLTYGRSFGDELCQWQPEVDLTPYLERFAALLADAVPGTDRHEWSSAYDLEDAAQEVEDKMASQAQVVPQLEPVEGDQLPPVGSRIFIRHGRDDDAHACIVTGYYVWGDLKGDKRLHRVFVRMVYEGTQTQNARMLCDCYKTEAEALATTQEKT